MENKVVHQAWNDMGSAAGANTVELDVWDLCDVQLDRPSGVASEAVLCCYGISQD